MWCKVLSTHLEGAGPNREWIMSYRIDWWQHVLVDNRRHLYGWLICVDDVHVWGQLATVRLLWMLSFLGFATLCLYDAWSCLDIDQLAVSAKVLFLLEVVLVHMWLHSSGVHGTKVHRLTVLRVDSALAKLLSILYLIVDCALALAGPLAILANLDICCVIDSQWFGHWHMMVGIWWVQIVFLLDCIVVSLDHLLDHLLTVDFGSQRQLPSESLLNFLSNLPLSVQLFEVQVLTFRW
jgi:hypothetical protein